MQGNLILNTSSPTNDLQAASKGYVDSSIANSFKKFLIFDTYVDFSNYMTAVTLPSLESIGGYISNLLFEFTAVNFGTSETGTIRISQSNSSSYEICSLRVQGSSNLNFTINYLFSSLDPYYRNNNLEIRINGVSIMFLSNQERTNFNIINTSIINAFSGTMRVRCYSS